MVFKRFNTIILLRTVFLCLSIFALFFLFTDTKLVATTFIVSLLIIYQIYSFIQFVQRTNREIARFFNSIKYSDFSQSFKPTIKGSSFEELSSAFSDVIEEFKKTRTEKEEHYRYLQTIVQHVGVGLITFKLDGEVEMINTATKKLLKKNSIRNISELSEISSALVETLKKINAGDKVLIKIPFNNEFLQLSIYAAEFKLRGNKYKLISLSNIQRELEEREMEAWQNLIRVLTHEIMNSVTPIISLSSTASSLLEKIDSVNNRAGNDELSELIALQEDVKAALKTIQKRSKGLLHFVDDYRNLTRIPIPNFQVVKISNLFERIRNLFSDQFNEKKIKFSASIEPNDLEVTIDPDLIEQVIINLILNSFAALSDTTLPEIKLKGTIDSRSEIIIQVIDNGPGVPEELYEKIFIPFFTTRKDGAGIGLSLSKQIMGIHKGGIKVKSIPNEETTFTLYF